MRKHCTIFLTILLVSSPRPVTAKTLFKVIEDTATNLWSYYKNHKPESTKKTIKTMNLDELKQKKEEFLAVGDKTTAVKFADKMVSMCNDLNQRGLYMLDFADLHFELGNLKKAELVYKEFSALYPNFKIDGVDKTEYALYKEILCSYLSILDADRDQTKTKETLTLVDSFSERSQGTFITYTNDVMTIKKQCVKRTMDSEISIFNYYLKRGSYRAAEHRLAKIEEGYKGAALEVPQVGEILSDLKVALQTKKAEAGITVPLLGPVPTKNQIIASSMEETLLANADKKSMVERF